jgi:hypothetical protein
MTVAVCTSCGALKPRATTRCAECRFKPYGHEATARAMVLTTHFLSREDLEAISERLVAGKDVTYPEEVVAQIVERLRRRSASRIPFAFKISFALIIMGVIGVVALVLTMMS